MENYADTTRRTQCTTTEPDRSTLEPARQTDSDLPMWRTRDPAHSVLPVADLDEGDDGLTLGLRPLFQVPVYAESQDTYYDWLRDQLAQHGDAAVSRGGSRDHAERMARHSVGTSWRYNRVIGWIDIRVASDVIKGYLTWTDQKQVRRARREAFSFQAPARKLFEIWLDDRWPAGTIYSKISDALEDVRRESPIKGRWMDRTAFDAVGPHLDYPGLFGWRQAI